MKGKKTGGRQKGTPNKTTGQLKQRISCIIDQYETSGQLSRDIEALEPRERITIMERLMQYVVPKMKSVEMELNETGGGTTLEDRLRQLSQIEQEDN